MIGEQHSNRKRVISRMSPILSTFGVEYSVSGGKYDDLRQNISPANGYWADRTVVAKPSRLIVHFSRAADGSVVARIPPGNDNGNFAYANTAHRQVGALCVRVMAVVEETLSAMGSGGTTVNRFYDSEQCEWMLWYCFWPALENGSSGQLFYNFRPATGKFSYMGHEQPYIAAGLVQLNVPQDVVSSSQATTPLLYGEATDALRRLIMSAPDVERGITAPPAPITVYSATLGPSMQAMDTEIALAFQRATASVVDEEESPELREPEPIGPPEIPVLTDLIGIEPEVYRQINAALQSGKQHLMFYGPPGTGKTTLAEQVASVLSEEWKLLTGSADWTSQDVIGGYHPLAGGLIQFLPGFLLQHFDKPVIFDELNRCDIDKVIGPLFTVLSGQGTTLPYLIDATDPDSQRVEILPRGTPNPPRTYAPLPRWRLIATINSIDKASLYQMSYALTRRFAWIYVDAPPDPQDFIRQFIARFPESPQAASGDNSPLGDMWLAVNVVRRIGAAPIIDIIKMIRSAQPGFSFFDPILDAGYADPYLDGFYVTLLPMLDGILRDEGDTLAERFCEILRITGDRRGIVLTERIRGLTI